MAPDSNASLAWGVAAGVAALLLAPWLAGLPPGAPDLLPLERTLALHPAPLLADPPLLGGHLAPGGAPALAPGAAALSLLSGLQEMWWLQGPGGRPFRHPHWVIRERRQGGPFTLTRLSHDRSYQLLDGLDAGPLPLLLRLRRPGGKVSSCTLAPGGRCPATFTGGPFGIGVERVADHLTRCLAGSLPSGATLSLVLALPGASFFTGGVGLTGNARTRHGPLAVQVQAGAQEQRQTVVRGARPATLASELEPGALRLEVTNQGRRAAPLCLWGYLWRRR